MNHSISVISILVFPSAGSGFCQSCLLVLNQPFTPTISRAGGNQIAGNAALRIAQTPQGNWTLWVTTVMEFRTSGGGSFGIVQQASTSPIPITPSTPVGTSYGAPINVALQPRGDGEYRVTVTANGICSGIGYNLTPNNPSPSPVLQVLRPRITGPGGAASPYGIWWLGGFSDDANGYYNRATLSVDANGSPGSPNWSVPQGASKVTLSCTNCTFPLVTSAQPSANCTYDVTLQVDYGGFYSPSYQLNVNAPYYMESGGLSSTSNYGDGWITVVPYLNRDRCNYPMSSLALNEQFGSFTSSLWSKPPAQGLSGYGGYIWYDQIFITGCTGCTPPSQQNNPPGQTFVDEAPQYWQLGSSVPGWGIYVQLNTFRRYTGHGEHVNLIRILY